MKTKIHVGKNILSILKKNKLIASASTVVVITDTNVARHWRVPLEKVITIVVDPGEKNKTIRTLEFIWSKMLKEGVDRSSVVLTLGGGVVCDIGGLAAGTFMRGIPVIHIPTTLLAQIDASVGGKTAIDFHGIKNSIGIFHQPSEVIIDVETLKTLPRRQLISGLAEVIKHAVISDKKLFSFLSKINLDEMDDKTWIEIIKQSLKIKQTIVAQDKWEKNGVRKKLNFGHTIGHAVEALSLKTNTPLLHGEAVALGMIAETRMSCLAGNISEKDEVKICDLINKFGLPKNISGILFEQILQHIKTDKKNRGKTVLWSLPFGIGKVKSDCILKPEIIKAGILSLIK